MAKLTPRFRKELPAAATETDGVPGVFVTDPQSGTTFTFYEFEYDLAHQLDGRQDYDEVVAWAAANYQTGLSPEAIDEFASKLAELGFLDLTVAAPAEDAAVPAPAEDSTGESAEAEWNSPQGVTTGQFTGPTVVPGDLPMAAAVAAVVGGTDPSLVSSDLLTELEKSGPVAAAGAAASSGVPQAIGPSGSGGVSALSSSGGVSRAFYERRQPPGPSDVVMTPFEDVSRRFRAPPPERQRSSTGLVVTVLVFVAAGAGGGYYYWMLKHPKVPEALRLRVVQPQPTAVYRWFAAPGTVVDLDARTMSFDAAGKVVELMPSGTKFAAGDTLGKLDGAASLEGELDKNKSKLAAFEQLRDSMNASGKKGDLRDVEDKIAARKKMIDEVQASLAKVVLRAPEAGSIVETSAKVGAVAAAKAPVLKWRGRSLHGDFTMDQEDFAKASKLEFCRVEVAGLGAPGTTPGAATTGAAPAAAATDAASSSPRDGGATAASGEARFVDCMLPPPAPPPTNGVPNLLRKFIVTLPTEAGLVTGQQLHLARRRFDAVFPLPLSAVQAVNETEAKIWVAANGSAEQRNITVAESRDEVLVAAGVNVGDQVIVDPPHDLTPGALVQPIK
jgi:multidrug efflux pump subunit AcrA (membrane-fusion protein)